MVNGQAYTILRHIHQLVGIRDQGDLPDRELLRRFAVDRDEAAFATLMQRHGGLVWGICRKTAGQEQDAEDAFQATFLVLARKAASLRQGDALAGWLYGVASRTALKARTASARRSRREREARSMRRNSAETELALRELQVILDEEVGSLPAKYRSPFVLCCLQGKTKPEAAKELGWKEGTVSSRLAQARKLLQQRLARRGVALSGALAAAALSPGAASATLPVLLAKATIEAALSFAAGSVAAGSGPAAALAKAVMQAMLLTKLKAVVPVVLAVMLLAGSAGLAAHHLAGQEHAASPPAEPKPLSTGDDQAAPSPQERAHSDRYGDPLPEGAIARLGTVRFRHGRVVSSVAFSEDGKTLLSGSYDGTVRLWDRDTAREIRRLEQLLPYGVVRVAFSLNGQTAAALSGDSRIRFWEVATGKQLGKIEGGFSFALAPDGKTVATGDPGDDLIRLWDWPTGKELRQVRGHKGRVFCVAFSPDGRSLASAGRDNTIRLWDPVTGRELRRLLEGDFHGRYFAPQFLAFSPDGETMASGDGTKLVRVWETATGKEFRQLREPSGEVCAVAFSPVGRILASGSPVGICLWDVTTGKQLHQLKVSYHPGQPSIAFSPDGRLLASGTEDGLIHLWDVGTGQEVSSAGGHQHWICSVALSADGKLLASGSYDGDIRLWETTTGRELHHIKGDTRPLGVYGVAIAPDGKTLAWGGEDKIIHLWDRSTGQELRRIEGHQALVAFVAFSPGGEKLVSGSGDGTIRFWDLGTGKEVRRLGTGEKLFPLALSSDGKRLAATATGGGRRLHLLEVSTGTELGQLEDQQPDTTTAAFAPDGRILASASLTGPMICLWDVITGKLLRRIKREKLKDVDHTPMIFQLAFSPDGKTLVSAEEASTVFAWEVATGQKRGVLAGHQGPVHAVSFSADGRLLATGSADTSALIWDITGGTPQRRREVDKLTQKGLRALWTDLAAADASKAYEAVLTLTVAAGRAVPYLRQQLQPSPVVEPASLAQLIKDLDSEQFGAREKVTRELEKLGESAEMALREALRARFSLEARRRMERLLEKLDVANSPQRLQRLRAIEVLERIGTSEARGVLRTLANGAPGTRLTQEAKASLDRLTRRPGTLAGNPAND